MTQVVAASPTGNPEFARGNLDRRREIDIDMVDLVDTGFRQLKARPPASQCRTAGEVPDVSAPE